MERYNCNVTPTDVLSAYVTHSEHPPEDEFALVMTNIVGQKIGVILKVADVVRLRDQLDLFLNGGE